MHQRFKLDQALYKHGFTPDKIKQLGSYNAIMDEFNQICHKHFTSEDKALEHDFRLLCLFRINIIFLIYNKNCRTHFPRFFGIFFKTVENGLEQAGCTSS